MKDFLKIFAVLSLMIGAFVAGRNYGAENFKNSDEYKEIQKSKDEALYVKSNLENIRAKLQNTLDGLQSKNAEEVSSQLAEIFSTDLGLKIENKNNFLKMNCKVAESASQALAPATAEAIHINEHKESAKDVTKKEPNVKKYDYRRLKSYEWILQNTTDMLSLENSLKNVEIKNIDLFLKSSKEAKSNELVSLLGAYRGRIKNINGQEYGTLIFEANPFRNENGVMDESKINGRLKIIQGGREVSSRTFTDNKLGQTVEGLDGIIIENGNQFYQVYKIKDTQQLAGYYYERLVNGTTKTIGTFILNRVDQF